MRIASLLLLPALGACTPAYCDPSGACHPQAALGMDRPVLLRLMNKPNSIYPGEGRAYAFALPESGPFCQVFLPEPSGPQDNEWQSLLWHELRHCAEGEYHG